MHLYICTSLKQFGETMNKMYFCNGRKKEKLGDYLLDISKYVLTAILITLFFNDISSSKVLTYLIGAMVAVATLYWGMFYFKK